MKGYIKMSYMNEKAKKLASSSTKKKSQIKNNDNTGTDIKFFEASGGINFQEEDLNSDVHF